MKSGDNFKPRLLSSQKVRRRRVKNQPTRDRIDLMDLHRRVATERRQRHSTKPRWLKAVALIIAIAVFFMIGYLIAALSVPIWAKVLLCFFVAIVALVMSCLMTDLLNA